MKKLTLVLIAVLIVFGLVACKNPTTPDPPYVYSPGEEIASADFDTVADLEGAYGSTADTWSGAADVAASLITSGGASGSQALQIVVTEDDTHDFVDPTVSRAYAWSNNVVVDGAVNGDQATNQTLTENEAVTVKFKASVTGVATGENVLIQFKPIAKTEGAPEYGAIAADKDVAPVEITADTTGFQNYSVDIDMGQVVDGDDTAYNALALSFDIAVIDGSITTVIVDDIVVTAK